MIYKNEILKTVSNGNKLDLKITFEESDTSSDVPNPIIKDDYHTMDELYNHRTMLFAALCNEIKIINEELGYALPYSWKSRKHSDGTSEEGWFIAGIETILGQITYHQKDEFWDYFKCKELEMAPEYDGHTPDDVLERLKTLY